MSRTPLQRDKLRAMGLRVWAPLPRTVLAAPPVDAPDASTPAPRPVAQPPAPATRAVEPPPAFVPAVLAAQAPVPAVAAELAALDWSALQGRVAECRACRLCEGRRQTVFGVGHPQARWMVVGEAPGEQEDLKGEPFVGAAGQLLDRMLGALGLTRGPADAERQVYIANTLKCRPPRNRNPQPDEVLRCLPYLHRQIELVQPRLIVAMGRFAIEAMTGSTEAVGRQRGRVHRFRGIPVVATYHPAYLLRSPSEKGKSWADLSLAAKVARDAAAAPTSPSLAASSPPG